MPTLKPWREFSKVCKIYGDLVYLNVLGTPILVIASSKLANEFLNTRSANSPDRPTNPVVELSGQDINTALIPYGQWWRRHRRLFWQQFHPGTIQRYLPIQRACAHKFLASLLAPSQQLRNNIRFSFQATILQIVYGVVIEDETDSRLSIAADAIEAIGLATPGHFAVEIIPLLRYLPSWFPGGGFQKLFSHSKKANLRLKHELFDEVKDSFVRGEHRPCVATDLLRRYEDSAGRLTLGGDEEEVVKDVCAVAVEGSADTTGYTLEAFFVAMALHPEVQRKAQAELDAVVGPGRLPDHSDSERLVYINAVVKEALRWHVVLPIGVAHRTLEDDEFCGYFIPAGTTIIPNVWGMLHDPEVYKDPFVFYPERFIKDGKLDPAVPDPTELMFGFGRRICPGRYLALPSLFINIASILHVFNIGLPLDENGEPVPLEYIESHGLTSPPEVCKCTIKPRSADAEALIVEARRAAAMYNETLS
ncbi:cytochrome P450 [Trametes polyzona]|nr:cytochrome P450 [Trametes polyzona]